LEDALEFRLVPGEGVIDLVGWLRALAARGIVAPVSVEVLSRDFNGRPLLEAAQYAADQARRVIDGAGATFL
jgi:sugar phosphate isomerase/epimerase